MSYCSMIHYHFNQANNQNEINLLEQNLLKPFQEAGCLNTQVLQDENDPQHLIQIGEWQTEQEAERFQSKFDSILNQMETVFSQRPTQHLYLVKRSYGMGEHNKRSRAA